MECRPQADWGKYEKRKDKESIEGRVFHGLKKLIDLRKKLTAFAGGELQVIDTENEHVLGFIRSYESKQVLVLANFSESPQVISESLIEKYIQGKKVLYGSSQNFIESFEIIIFG